MSESYNEPPWAKRHSIHNIERNSDLNDEILDFSDWISPTDDERLIRLIVVKRFNSCVRILWPEASIVCHGSSATDTFLPDGDIDFVLINTPSDRSQEYILEELNGHLIECQQLRSSQVISQATVPIIKGVEFVYGFSVDIAFNNDNGILNIPRNLSLFGKYTSMKPLLFILKVFLEQKGLNQPYTGGISSNTLIQLIHSILQISPDEYLGNCGSLLLLFFKIFGKEFNFYYTGISTRKGGRVFPIRTYDKPCLQIEDPQAPGCYLGGNAFRIEEIREACFDAYTKLSAAKSQKCKSMLLSIIKTPIDIINFRENLMKVFENFSKPRLACFHLSIDEHFEEEIHRDEVQQRSFFQIPIGRVIRL